MPEAVAVTVANMEKRRRGEKRRHYRARQRAYLRHLESELGHGLLLLQERGNGVGSVRIRRVGGFRLSRRLPTWTVGRRGAHRGVARARSRVAGRTVRWFNFHALHRGTVGRVVQDRYYFTLARRLRVLNSRGILWAASCDANRSLPSVARLFGGTPHGVGIVGLVLSPGLAIVPGSLRVDATGMGNGWTDHPAVSATVTRA